MAAWPRGRVRTGATGHVGRGNRPGHRTRLKARDPSGRSDRCGLPRPPRPDPERRGPNVMTRFAVDAPSCSRSRRLSPARRASPRRAPFWLEGLGDYRVVDASGRVAPRIDADASGRIAYRPVFAPPPLLAGPAVLPLGLRRGAITGRTARAGPDRLPAGAAGSRAATSAPAGTGVEAKNPASPDEFPEGGLGARPDPSTIAVAEIDRGSVDSRPWSRGRMQRLRRPTDEFGSSMTMRAVASRSGTRGPDRHRRRGEHRPGPAPPRLPGDPRRPDRRRLQPAPRVGRRGSRASSASPRSTGAGRTSSTTTRSTPS